LSNAGHRFRGGLLSYRGLHALAWNALFPSPLEQTLWRISALVIASPAAISMPAVASLWLLTWFYDKVRLYLAKFNLISRPKQQSQPQTANVKENLSPQNNTSSEVLCDLSQISVAVVCTFFMSLRRTFLSMKDLGLCSFCLLKLIR
jgi:hypothetical protein